MIRRVRPALIDFLAAVDTKEDVEYAQQLVSQLDSHSVVLRQSRVECLTRHRDRLVSVVDSHLNRLHLVNQRLDQVPVTRTRRAGVALLNGAGWTPPPQIRAALMRRCDAQLTDIVVRTFTVLERRGEYEARRVREEERCVLAADGAPPTHSHSIKHTNTAHACASPPQAHSTHVRPEPRRVRACVRVRRCCLRPP